MLALRSLAEEEGEEGEEGEDGYVDAEQPAASRDQIKSYTSAYTVAMHALSHEKRFTQGGGSKAVVTIWNSQMKSTMVTHFVESVARFLMTKDEAPEMYLDRKKLPLAQIAVLNPAHALYRFPTVRGQPEKESLVSCSGLLTRPARGNFSTCMKHWDYDTMTLKPEFAAAPMRPEVEQQSEGQLPDGWQRVTLQSGDVRYLHEASGKVYAAPLPSGWEGNKPKPGAAVDHGQSTCNVISYCISHQSAVISLSHQLKSPLEVTRHQFKSHSVSFCMQKGRAGMGAARAVTAATVAAARAVTAVTVAPAHHQTESHSIPGERAHAIAAYSPCTFAQCGVWTLAYFGR